MLCVECLVQVCSEENTTAIVTMVNKKLKHLSNGVTVFETVYQDTWKVRNAVRIPSAGVENV